MSLSQFAEIILPLPLQGTFTYVIPMKKKVSKGVRVVVPFGKKKIYTGVVSYVHSKISQDYHPKEILDILDHEPVINETQLSFFQWMSDYYMCSLGEVMNAALPAALKLSSESFVGLNPLVDPEEANVEESERALLHVLKIQDLSVKEVGEFLNLKHPQKRINKLAEGGFIDLFEQVKDKYQPRKVKRVRIKDFWLNDNNLELLLAKLESKPKQQDILLSYLREIPILENSKNNEKGILKSVLLEDDISPHSLKTLIKNEVLEEWEENISRINLDANKKDIVEVTLSHEQEITLHHLRDTLATRPTTLFHGITGSGKTEIYIWLIKEQLEHGNQVLYLLPEIALTTQIIARLRKLFGNTFGVYHSRYSDNERVEVWQKVLTGDFQFVVGVRSAVFLPFSNLGLVVVDEEHEPSYKQYEPAPRYHARDAAIYLSMLHKSNAILGTATPSLESYKNALDGKYGLVKLTKRFGDAYEPEITYANIRKERKQNKLKGNFSSELINAIEQSLEKKEQVIIFQNRRGYAAYITCDNCAAIPKCANCAVSLTYHQFNNKLICHYCGYNQTMYSDCLHCGCKELRPVGFGTEELEEELKLIFPQAIIKRMDLDTTRSKYGYQRIIESLENQEIDILVGTQMVSKGFDFDQVNLVGIFDTDRMIHFPNFRSHERAYQLITQVSGRAGRKSKHGKVIIQTNDPQQQLLRMMSDNNYFSFYEWEMKDRERFHYPPFTRLITITFKHRDKKTSFQAANFFYHEISKQLTNQKIIGPVEPIIGKIRTLYLHEITLKMAKQGINLTDIKKYLQSVAIFMHTVPSFRSVGVVFDVDPV
ncbi:MAG: primosomal protein N' [Bacteroidota bacterium]